MVVIISVAMSEVHSILLVKDVRNATISMVAVLMPPTHALLRYGAVLSRDYGGL